MQWSVIRELLRFDFFLGGGGGRRGRNAYFQWVEGYLIKTDTLSLKERTKFMKIACMNFTTCATK